MKTLSKNGEIIARKERLGGEKSGRRVAEKSSERVAEKSDRRGTIGAWLARSSRSLVSEIGRERMSRAERE